MVNSKWLMVNGGLLLFVLLLVGMVSAIPEDMSVNGRLTDDSGVALSGTYNLNFSIYDNVTVGNLMWNSGNVSVTTDSNGVFVARLADVDLNFSDDYFLGVKVEADAEMTPRVNLSSSGYSFRARNVSVAGVEFSSNVGIGAYNFSVDSSVFFVDVSSDRVGVGVGSPLSLFHVGTGSGVNEVNLSGVVYVNSTSGNVGIGTTGSARLNIGTTVGSAGIDNELNVISHTATGAVVNIGKESGGTQSNDIVNIWSSKSDSAANMLRVINGATYSAGWSGGTTGFVVKGDGNVGIGTMGPTHELNVLGDANVTGLCVAEDSLISMADGSEKMIRDVRAGEEVLSLDEESGEIVGNEVLGLLDMGEKVIYELVTEDGRSVNTTGAHPYLVRGESGRGSVSNLSMCNVMNMSLNFSKGVSSSNLEKFLINACGLDCGILSQTTEKIVSLLYENLSVKSQSLVMNTLCSDLENLASSPFESCLGLKIASCPACLRNFNNSFFTFSSSRNLSFLFSDVNDDIVSSFGEISCILQSCLNMFFCEGDEECVEDFFCGDVSFEHFQDLPDHDSCAFEGGFSVADFAVCDDVFVDFDSHCIGDGSDYLNVSFEWGLEPAALELCFRAGALEGEGVNMTGAYPYLIQLARTTPSSLNSQVLPFLFSENFSINSNTSGCNLDSIGGCILMTMIAGSFEGGNSAVLRKSLSLDSIPLSSLHAREYKCEFLIPFCEYMMSMSLSMRNLTSLASTSSSENNLRFDIYEPLSGQSFGGIMEGCLDVFFGQGGVGFIDDFVDCCSSFEHFQYGVDHDSGAFESGSSVTDFVICDDVFVDFDSHCIDDGNDYLNVSSEWGLEPAALELVPRFRAGALEPAALELVPRFRAGALEPSALEGEGRGAGGRWQVVGGRGAEWIKVRDLSVGDEIAVVLSTAGGGGEGVGGRVEFVGIKEINVLGERHVYDLMIEGTHNFIANGIVAHNTYVGEDALFVNSTSGRVGIGTTSPSALLELNNDPNGGTLLHLEGYDNNVAITAMTVIDENGNLDFSITSVGDLGVTGATAYFRGNVGIGTTTPSKKFEVNGTAGGLVVDVSGSIPTINTTALTNVTITSAGGSVIIKLG